MAIHLKHECYLNNKIYLLQHYPIYKTFVPGQQGVLQSSLTDDPPAHVPPQDSVILFVLVFVLVPPLQDLEQVPVLHEFH